MNIKDSLLNHRLIDYLKTEHKLTFMLSFFIVFVYKLVYYKKYIKRMRK